MSRAAGLRMLAVADLSYGSGGYGFVRAFRRLGHSVRVIEAERFIPTDLRRLPLRILRRCFEPVLVREFNRALQMAAAEHCPDLFFVYKGRYVRPETVGAIHARGALAVNVFPDVSVLAHGPYIPRALPSYDWIFQTKRYGIADLERLLGVRHASFLPHAYDPDVHQPVALDDRDVAAYACDVAFIGTWSPKKEQLLEAIRRRLPSVRLRVWGGQWKRAAGLLDGCIQGRRIEGVEYAKALRASRINVAILSEAGKGASSGDQTTARTFEIPATGAFMLHERTTELMSYFTENEECGCFGSADELVEKIQYFLAHDEERLAIAARSRYRSVVSGYSMDDRAREVLSTLPVLRAGAACAE